MCAIENSLNWLLTVFASLVNHDLVFVFALSASSPCLSFPFVIFFTRWLKYEAFLPKYNVPLTGM